jgi:hypothetical protein
MAGKFPQVCVDRKKNADQFKNQASSVGCHGCGFAPQKIKASWLAYATTKLPAMRLRTQVRGRIGLEKSF